MKHSTSENGAWTTRRSLALLGTVALWAIAAIDLWFLWPANLGGGTSFVVVSGSSMEPTYFSGDLVIARDIEPSIGDVIVYAPDTLGGAQIVHRIIGGNAEDGWAMQGDNNSFIDPFEPSGDEVKGVVVVHYSDIGRVTALMLNPIFWAALLLAGIVMLVWFSGDDCDDDEDDADESPDDVAETEADDEAAPSRLSRAGPALRTSAFIAAAMWAFATGFSPAAAATLTVIAGDEAKPYTLNACGDPTPSWGSTTTATGTTSSQVTVSNIPAGCLNRPFTLTVRNTAGTVLATLTGTPTTSTFSFTMPSGNYTVAQVSTVIAKVGGWVFPTTWAPPTPSSPFTCQSYNLNGTPNAASCTVTVTNTATYTNNGYRYTNFQFSAVTTADIWQITVNLSSTTAGFTGMSPVRYVGTYQNVVSAPGYACTSLPTFIGREANPTWNSSGGELVFSDDPAFTAGTMLCDI